MGRLLPPGLRVALPDRPEQAADLRAGQPERNAERRSVAGLPSSARPSGGCCRDLRLAEGLERPLHRIRDPGRSVHDDLIPDRPQSAAVRARIGQLVCSPAEY